MNVDPIDSPPPADPAAPPPPADPAPPADNARKPPSQGFLDSQRAMSLKWAIRRGSKKDGSPIPDEDKAWYAKWEADHPEKSKAPTRPPLGVVEGEEAPPPRPRDATSGTATAKSPPRVDPDPPRDIGSGKKAAAKTDWRTKYRDGLKVEKLAGIKVAGADGKPIELDPREVVCIGTAGVICGLLKSCEDALALIGAKPYFGISVDMLAGAIVLLADEQLPKNLEVKPEHVVAFGAAAIVAPRIVHYKAIKAAKAKAADENAHKSKLDEMRERTKKQEAAYAAQQERAATATASSPPPSSPPREEVVEVKGGQSFASPSSAQQEMARETFDPERKWEPNGDLIV